jgi:hypothetical protein
MPTGYFMVLALLFLLEAVEKGIGGSRKEVF